MRKPTTFACIMSVLLGISTANAADIVAQQPAEQQTQQPEQSTPFLSTPAQFRPYVSAFGGVSWLGDLSTNVYSDNRPYPVTMSFDRGYTYGATAGVKWGDYLRAEAEVSQNRWNANNYSETGQYRTFTFSASGPIVATFAMANAWVDIPTSLGFTPYAGGGAGWGWANADTHFGNDSRAWQGGGSGFAYQVGAGVKYSLTDHIAIDVGYRYKVLNNITFQTPCSACPLDPVNLKSHNAQLGLTYTF